MSSLILPRRFTSQPQGAVEVDWTNPLTRGLLSLVSPSGIDAVSRSPLAKSGAASTIVTQAGIALGTTGTGYWSGGVVIPSTNVSGFAYGYPTALSLGKGYLLDLPSAPLYLGSNYDAGTSLSVETGFGQKVVLASYYPKTTPTAVGFTVSGAWGALKLYADGKLAASGSAGGFSGDTAVRVAENQANVLFAAVWNRILSEAEFKLLTDNPWQLFRAKPRVLYFTTSSESGGVAGTISTTISDFTSSMSGTTTTIGSISSTLENYTSNISGTVSIVGTISNTIEDFTSNIEGSLGGDVSGTILVTIEDYSTNIEGTTGIVGTISVTLEANNASIEATTTILGTIAQQMQDFTSSIYGFQGDEQIVARLRTVIGTGT